MHAQSPDAALLLGRAGARDLRLSYATLQASFAHARRIAADLGNHEAESSVAAYWSLASRVQQWQVIVDRIGRQRAGQARIVEVGSGMGLFVLTGVALGFQALGVESSNDRYEQSLWIARDLFRDNGLPPPFLNACAEALPLRDASADLVASFQTLEHVRDLGQALREIRRVLKPGGIFFAQVPNYQSFFEAHYGVLAPLGMGKVSLRRYLRLRGRPAAFLDHLQWISPSLLRRQIVQAGFASANVGRIARPTYQEGAIDAAAHPLPFHFRRGVAANRLAQAVALLLDRSGVSADYYPQIEIWASA
jgi:SAM-dependent methyltransferase